MSLSACILYQPVIEGAIIEPQPSDNPDNPSIPQVEDSEASKEAFAPQFNFDFEEENTVQADYEAID